MADITVVLAEVLHLGARQVASSATSTDTAATATPTSGGNGGGGGGNTTQSPLLFFVALGFGVVFTNLWYASVSRGI
jgi:hypothetical protein